jgi:DNA repair exonuclease SbcCD ATPase subunit
MSVEQTNIEATLDVQNIGGIDETSVVFEPGVTVLAGRNATNRTSLLQGIMAALGSDDVSVKADADEAHVELDIAGETYTRTLESTNGRVRGDGEPYLEDPTLGDLFAFLLESNEARRAVVTDADLRDIIMRPVDTDEIQAEIDRLVEKRREISDELDELDDLKNRLPSLEEKKTGLEERIEDKKAELAEVEAEIEAADADVEEGREEQAELEEKLEQLRDKRSDLEDVRYELETEQDSLESLRAEKRDVETEYDDLPETPAGDLDELDSRIDRLRTQKQELESELNELQSVIGFNQEMLEADTTEPVAALEDGGADGPVTDELLADETVTCWTCGSEVESDQIETTVEKLQDRSQEIVGEINDTESELDEVKATRRERQDQQRQRERLERRRKELEDDIEDTEARIETLTDRREALQEDIEDIEAEVEALESDAYEEILDQHKEANQLEYDLGTLENDLERVEENIATIEARLDEEADLEAEREDVNDEIEDLRTRIERIEQEAIEAFNDNMETVLELLEYENLARIWLERTETEVREGRRKVTKSVFDLHIVRQTDSGATYEDVVENLSESEREVTGLIFALAGYLAHDVYETVPFMLLDSLEAIDSNRIAILIDHLEEYSDFLVVALLPEDASKIETDQRIESI